MDCTLPRFSFEGLLRWLASDVHVVGFPLQRAPTFVGLWGGWVVFASRIDWHRGARAHTSSIRNHLDQGHIFFIVIDPYHRLLIHHHSLTHTETSRHARTHALIDHCNQCKKGCCFCHLEFLLVLPSPTPSLPPHTHDATASCAPPHAISRESVCSILRSRKKKVR